MPCGIVAVKVSRWALAGAQKNKPQKKAGGK